MQPGLPVKPQPLRPVIAVPASVHPLHRSEQQASSAIQLELQGIVVLYKNFSLLRISIIDFIAFHLMTFLASVLYHKNMGFSTVYV